MKKAAGVRYWILLWACRLVGLLPTWFLYHGLLDFLYFILYRVARYRLETVRSNLARSFPEKSAEERLNIERAFYRHLAEVFVDTIDIVSIGRREAAKRIVFEGVEEQEKALAGQDWIAALAHYGSWEYFSIYQYYTDHQVVGVYHPLHDPAFDRFYRTTRSRFGIVPVAMHSVLRYVINKRRNEQQNMILGLIADQTPPRSEASHWYMFLGQRTSFFRGIEKFALKFAMPVYFMHIEKRSRARYRARFICIYDGQEQVEEGVITERYVHELEKMIREAPELWMWSHRRWKHKIPEEHAFRNKGSHS